MLRVVIHISKMDEHGPNSTSVGAPGDQADDSLSLLGRGQSGETGHGVFFVFAGFYMFFFF